mmetsp:Transcript_25751/g.36391  ORF Transcript_25751/g.36391 Transcript_25751/m.36391 type:complete len:848 (-) Transcript_25751:109-2652(-)|eukprot:CAMPEP_0175099730 /NCGR_PEP_ID=MMETSP0086_2-20121207/6630_1 /TAXON_ID=136419 /ORGANISM="Unknown Unknown, Strain D1" /LENGTH=847 /DNA_ID=CAMNT_0016373635 /DNA_START=186 /DNA_END=2729 /DNA_ORIENTATION=+
MSDQMSKENQPPSQSGVSSLNVPSVLPSTEPSSQKSILDFFPSPKRVAPPASAKETEVTKEESQPQPEEEKPEEEKKDCPPPKPPKKKINRALRGLQMWSWDKKQTEDLAKKQFWHNSDEKRSRKAPEKLATMVPSATIRFSGERQIKSPTSSVPDGLDISEQEDQEILEAQQEQNERLKKEKLERARKEKFKKEKLERAREEEERLKAEQVERARKQKEQRLKREQMERARKQKEERLKREVIEKARKEEEERLKREEEEKEEKRQAKLRRALKGLGEMWTFQDEYTKKYKEKKAQQTGTVEPTTGQTEIVNHQEQKEGPKRSGNEVAQVAPREKQKKRSEYQKQQEREGTEKATKRRKTDVTRKEHGSLKKKIRGNDDWAQLEQLADLAITPDKAGTLLSTTTKIAPTSSSSVKKQKKASLVVPSKVQANDESQQAKKRKKNDTAPTSLFVQQAKFNSSSPDLFQVFDSEAPGLRKVTAAGKLGSQKPVEEFDSESSKAFKKLTLEGKLSKLEEICTHNLRKLVLRVDGLQDCNFLTKCTNLTYLDLTSCVDITCIKGVSSLASLRYLKLSGCEEVKDYSPLSNLSNLVALNLSWHLQLTSLAPLKRLKMLKTLDLSGCNALAKDEDLVCELLQLPALSTLDVTDCTAGQDMFRAFQQVKPNCIVKGLAAKQVPRPPPAQLTTVQKKLVWISGYIKASSKQDAAFRALSQHEKEQRAEQEWKLELYQKQALEAGCVLGPQTSIASLPSTSGYLPCRDPQMPLQWENTAAAATTLSSARVKEFMKKMSALWKKRRLETDPMMFGDLLEGVNSDASEAFTSEEAENILAKLEGDNKVMYRKGEVRRI